jgi:hypothetical protein
MYTHHHHRIAALGLDLGQQRDPSALTLLTEISQITSPHHWYDATHPQSLNWVVSATHVFPLGTPYTDIAEQTIALAAAYAAAHPKTSLFLIADSTGLGRPVLELLRQEQLRLHTYAKNICRLEGVVFTSGREANRYGHPTLPIDMYNVPKLELLNSLALSIESGLLKIPEDLPNKDVLYAQLNALEVHYPSRAQSQHGPTSIQAGLDTTSHRAPIIRLNPDALESSGAKEVLAHADLVMSLALATWRLHQQQRPSNKGY